MVPKALGSFQGNFDYWWTWYWLPFWDGLTDQQRFEYLRDVDASDAWVECIEAHCSKR
jgi:hypothetical protein